MKKLNIKIALTYLLLIFIISGCGTKCDDFNNDVLEWLPYKVYDRVILYKSGYPDTLSVSKSEIDHTDKLRYGSKCTCENNFLVYFWSDSILIEILFNNSNNIESRTANINNNNLNYTEHLDSLTLNGIYYKDLIIFKGTDFKNENNYNKIIISKSIGIIGIFSKNDSLFINNNTTRKINIKDVKFYSSKC